MTTKQQVVCLLVSAVTAACGGIWRREAAVRIRRGTALLVLAVLVSLAGAAQPEPTAIPVKGDAPTFLYGGGAASKDDCVKKQAGDSFRWTGSGQIIWTVQVDRAGDYEVALNHAAEPGAVGQHLQVSSGDSRVGYTLAMTKGVFGNKSYEMTPIKGPLRLRAKLGSKRHLICDRRGIPLAIQLTGANRNDSQQALALVDAIPPLQGLPGASAPSTRLRSRRPRL